MTHSVRPERGWVIADKPAVLYPLSTTRLLELVEQRYRDAAGLMERTAMGGHTIDALVAAAALKV